MHPLSCHRIKFQSARRYTSTMARPKTSICLWYNNDAEEAANFYASVFPNTSMEEIVRAPADYPAGKEGDPIVVWFNVMGIQCMGLNGGPAFKHCEAFSFQVETESQEETDKYWNAIVDNGGEESMCGWCKDKWGISWQITPAILNKALSDPDRAASKRVFEAMMEMQKIDIAKIEAAYRG